MASIGFYYGALSDSLEVQANKQGYTLGDKAEIFEKCAYGLTLNHVRGVLTDSVYDRALRKLNKEVVNSCQPLKKEGYI